MQPAQKQQAESEAIQTVVTQGIMATLSADEIHAAVAELRKKMKVPDPENPNLWTVQIGQREIWGILDEHAGPNGEDVFTVLFPSEY